ncbi:hypothetical protein SSP24_40390 [Streptomyces spinoverrucosus]|uniref:Uncharacterized protein n=1 Tax=Streptomyces spinoverrucosus TaxID=284043 RepID=A0A4Y3VHH7_9ACTN|nr:hypothetical protein [Streptomyces spinoverrucosus]GEC06384.1 hypothetical protein SSP24_40390 [Streptomyces spinoverrucosus]GHB86980.1 hypothetical protein GCM10010397_68280 [Streptomyces spinoverrucosus]
MLTELSITLFVLSALLILMACLKADVIRRWRESVNPSAPEIPDAAFVVARITLIGVAVACAVSGVQGLGVEDDLKWSDDELKSAVNQATYELDGYLYRVDESGEPVAVTDDYETLIESEVVENGGGDAPQGGVAAEPAAGNSGTDAYFNVSGNGTDAEFCTHIKRVRSKQDDYTPPGLDEGTWTQLAYRLTVTTREGAC